MNLLLIFLGCGFGGISRFLITDYTYQILGRSFPYGTLVVNVIGSFLMGFLFFILMTRVIQISPYLRSFLLIGFLGGFTTFASFSLANLQLIESGAFMKLALNILISVFLCLLAVFLGVYAAEKL